MNKLFTVSVAALGLGLGLFGCDFGPLSPDTNEVSITLGVIPAITSASNQAVTGNVDANVEITSITPVIKDASGATVTTITISKNNVDNTKKKIDLKTDLALTLVVGAQTCNGTYTLELTAVAGTASTTKSATFTVSGVKNCNDTTPQGTPVVTATISAGSNSNSDLGSSIDLDAGVAYKMSAAASHVAELDLCYSSTGAGVDKLGSPNWAKLSNFDYAKNWTAPPATKFYKTDLTKAQFDAITTKEQIPAFVDASATAESYPAALNDVFTVKTTAGATVLVLINAKTDGAAGSITIKTSK
jgi:hypothetical protein